MSEFEKAVRELVEKLDLISRDGRYISVFSIAQNHGYTYNGPTYSEELKRLKDILHEMDSQ